VLPEVQPKGFEFGGSGYIIISKGNYRPARQSPVKFSFRTFASDGLMFVMGTPGADFLSIEMEDGRVVGKYDLGSGTGVLRSSGPVERYNDGQWHDLYMNRIGNDGLLKIDNLSGCVNCIDCDCIEHLLCGFASTSMCPKIDRRSGPPSSTWFVGHTQVHTPNSIWISSWLCHTGRCTDHASSAAAGCIFALLLL